jgi:hypothetical protein
VVLRLQAIYKESFNTQLNIASKRLLYFVLVVATDGFWNGILGPFATGESEAKEPLKAARIIRSAIDEYGWGEVFYWIIHR